MPRLYLMADEVDPMTIGPSLYQEEKIIVFPVGQIEMGAMTDSGAIDLPDLKKVVPILGGLTEGVMRDGLFLPEIVQLKWNWPVKVKQQGITTSVSPG